MSYRIKRGLITLMLLVMAIAVTGTSQAGPQWRDNTNSKAATSGGQCVRETDWMRKNHMALLKHDRDVTVHEGIRTVDGSLSGCVACHVNYDNGKHLPVNAMEGPDGAQFCAGCHAFTGVKLDCFQCHSPVPAE